MFLQKAREASEARHPWEPMATERGAATTPLLLRPFSLVRQRAKELEELAAKAETPQKQLVTKQWKQSIGVGFFHPCIESEDCQPEKRLFPMFRFHFFLSHHVLNVEGDDFLSPYIAASLAPTAMT